MPGIQLTAMSTALWGRNGRGGGSFFLLYCGEIFNITTNNFPYNDYADIPRFSYLYWQLYSDKPPEDTFYNPNKETEGPQTWL